MDMRFDNCYCIFVLIKGGHNRMDRTEATCDLLHLFAEELTGDQFIVTAEELAQGVAPLGVGCFGSLTTFSSACGTASSLGCLGTLSA